MADAIDISVYSTVLFLDSMVALEAKPLSSLPWHEIDSNGPILILVVPQVMKEIDKRKRDGRLGRRAREFNRLIGSAAEKVGVAEITSGLPRVDIGFAVCDRINWDTIDDLDPEEGDARVVAQIIHARNISKERKLLLSYDNNPIAMASRHGIRAKKLADHWLLDPEPSPGEKELQKLKGRINELEAAEPEIEFELTFEVPSPLIVFQINPLTGIQQKDFIRRILKENAPYQQNDFAFDYSYDEKYEEYESKTVPRHVAGLHRGLEEEFGQVAFTLTIRNIGHIQAENLVVALHTTGGGLHDKFRCYPTYGPRAPRPRNELIPAITSMRFPHIKDPVGRHDMEFAIGPNGGSRIEVHCADFRQGRSWVLNGIARIDPHLPGPFAVELDVTASNQRGSSRRTFEQAFEVRTVSPAEVIKLEGIGFLMDFPLKESFERALKERNTNWLEFSTLDDDSEIDDEND